MQMNSNPDSFNLPLDKLFSASNLTNSIYRFELDNHNSRRNSTILIPKAIQLHEAFQIDAFKSQVTNSWNTKLLAHPRPNQRAQLDNP